ncbi:hypothetical protein GCM10009710_18590 [Aeromicrobium alkaliterrae]|uniref:Uncharacterized protein n=1 Tax=Aeromicrobium alkaliterrae TaxID=302168 RepID=A0ABN2JTK2_9ACTN
MISELTPFFFFSSSSLDSATDGPASAAISANVSVNATAAERSGDRWMERWTVLMENLDLGKVPARGRRVRLVGRV